MISFRYHLVSLMAIFLAIAFGIVIGAAVVDQATVDLLENRLEAVENRAEATAAENADLRVALDGWTSFAEQSGDRLVDGRLAGTPVLVVAVRGTSPEVVESLRTTLLAAGAFLRGTIWLTPRLSLVEGADTAELASVVDLASSAPDVVRRAAVTALAETLGGVATEPLDLPALRDRGFLEVEVGLGEPPVDPLEALPVGTRIVVVSSPAARVRNDDLAVPLVTALGEVAPRRVLATEPTVPDDDTDRGFVAVLRREPSTASVVSTVDSIDAWRSRIAAVLALVEQGSGRVGHYGRAPGATAQVPPVADGG